MNASFPSDKLTALSGIAEQFHAKLQCGYLAGLWRDHLLRGLQWSVADGNKAWRGLPYRAPTWSWASLDKLSSTATGHHGVRVTYKFTELVKPDNRLVFVDGFVPSDGKNPYGAVSEGGVIVLRAAFLTPSTAEIETELSWVDEVESILLLQLEGHEGKIRVEPDIAFTSLPLGISHADAKELRWLVLGKIENKHYGLILKLSKGREEVYKRVGEQWLKKPRGEEDVYERVGLKWFHSPSFDLEDKAEVAEFKII